MAVACHRRDPLDRRNAMLRLQIEPDVSLAYEEKGSGPLFVLNHGLGGHMHGLGAHPGRATGPSRPPSTGTTAARSSSTKDTTPCGGWRRRRPFPATAAPWRV